jgi:predicted TPR repeat methyltransferase
MKNKPGPNNGPTWRFDPPSPTTMSGDSPAEMLSRAVALHQGGQLEAAEPLYRAALALQPHNGDALHLLGVLRYQQRDPAAAVPLIEAALEIIPGNIFAWTGLGLALMRLGRFSEALETFDRALAIKPDFAEALCKRGDALHALGRHKDAVAAYNRSLRYRPAHAETLNNRAAALIDLGRPGESLTSLDQALAISPTYIEALNNRATALNALKRSAEALNTCDKALAIQPNIPQLHNNRGAALHSLGRMEEAVAAFRAALVEQPDVADFHANLGIALEAMGHPEQAEQHLQQALAAKPATLTYQTLASVLYQLKKTAEARALHQEWLQFDPENPIARHMVAASNEAALAEIEWSGFQDSTPNTVDNTKLLATYQRALADDPANADNWYHYGLTQHRLGRIEESLASYDRALAIQANHPQALNHRGIALCKLKNLQDGLTSFRRALELNPDSAEYQANIGRALLDLGQPEAAAANLYQALQIEKSATVFQSLASALYQLGRHDETMDIYSQWLAFEPDNPIPQHMVATGRATRPERASDQYVASIFDSFAETFESTLLGLGYRVPELLTAQISAARGTETIPLRILDAGCGTGLAAPLLKPLASQLVGVDLSTKMLDKARERKLYDELVVGELCAFMASRPGAFDLVLLADTLVYFGALDEAFRTAHAALAPSGIFAFAVEARPDSGPDYQLELHGRYSHRPDYLTRLLTTGGYTVQSLEPIVIRRELDTDVAGVAVVARRNPA